MKAAEVKGQLRSELISRIERVEAQSPTHISTVLIKGLNSLDLFLGRFIPQMIFATAIPVTVIGTLFYLDTSSALIAFATLPLIPIFGALIGKYTSDAVMKKWKELGTLSKYFEDSMRGFVTLKIFGRHRSQAERISAMGKRYTDETMKVLLISFLSSLVLELCATISVALIAVSVGVRLVDSAIAFLPSLAVLILAPEVYFPLRNAATLFHASVDGAEALRQVRELLESEKQESPREGVSLTWKRWRSDELGITIPEGSVAPGRRAHLVGESGLGKTTFINHVLDTLDPSQVSWIPQHPTLAQGTLRDQLLLVRPEITDNEIIDTYRKVGLEMESMRDGLETEIGGAGEKSSAASGGQIRKIAIARALVRKPSILIADEPTADLDQRSIEIVKGLFTDFTETGGALLVVTHEAALMDGDRVEVITHES